MKGAKAREINHPTASEKMTVGRWTVCVKWDAVKLLSFAVVGRGEGGSWQGNGEMIGFVGVTNTSPRNLCGI